LLSLFSLLPYLQLPNHTVHQIKENVLLLAEEECQLHTLLDRFQCSFLTFLFLLFISTRRSTTHSPLHSPHISLATPTCKPLALFVSLPPPNPPYARLPPFSPILSHPTQNLPGSYNQSSTSLRPPTNSPPSNSSSVNGLASQSTQQLPPQHQPTPAQSHPCATKATPACLSMNHSSSEPSTSDFSLHNAPLSGLLPPPFPRYGRALPASATPAGELFLSELLYTTLHATIYMFSQPGIYLQLSCKPAERFPAHMSVMPARSLAASFDLGRRHQYRWSGGIKRAPGCFTLST
jgi:hypothetical protein